MVGMLGVGVSLVNLANEYNFAKLKPSKRYMHITRQYLPICQTFIHKIIYQINFAKHYRHQTFPLYGICANTFNHFFTILCECCQAS